MKVVGQHLIISDLHVPWHNKILLKKVLQLAIDFKIKRLVINGDFGDMVTLSKFAEGSLRLLRDWTLSLEYRLQNEVLDLIGQVFKPKTSDLTFMWGNHEDRYWRYMERGDTSKLGEALISPTDGLRLRERGYKVHEHWKQDFIKIGSHLEVSHGQFTNINAAKSIIDKYQGSGICGHNHRIQTYYIGKRMGATAGGLFEIDSEGFWYMDRVTRSGWCNGLSVVTEFDDGTHHTNVIPVYNNVLVFGNRIY